MSVRKETLACYKVAPEYRNGIWGRKNAVEMQTILNILEVERTGTTKDTNGEPLIKFPPYEIRYIQPSFTAQQS